MLNLKKTAIAVLALSSSAAFAGTMGATCSAVPVTMPCESNGWEVGARALWYNIGGANQLTTLTSSSGGSISSNLNPQFGWGFSIDGRMLYGTGRYVSLDWEHVGTRVNGPTGSATLTGNQALVTGTQFLRGNYISSISATSRTANSNPKWDAVNMGFGQHVDFSDSTSAEFVWGWDWSRVGATTNVGAAGSATSNSNASGSDVSNTASFDFNASNSQVFDGFGPRVALRGTYNLLDSLDIYAEGNAAALAGFAKTGLTYTDYISSPNVTTTTNISKVTIVPVMDAKLGASFEWNMPSFAKIILDANYDFGAYINALSAAGPLGSVAAHAANFNYQGVSFGADFQFAG